MLVVLLVGTTDGSPVAVAGGRLGEGTSVVGVPEGAALGAPDWLPLADGAPVGDRGDVRGRPAWSTAAGLASVRVSTTVSTTATTTTTAATSNPSRNREREPEPGEATAIRTL